MCMCNYQWSDGDLRVGSMLCMMVCLFISVTSHHHDGMPATALFAGLSSAASTQRARAAFCRLCTQNATWWCMAASRKGAVSMSTRTSVLQRQRVAVVTAASAVIPF
jgi:Fe-S-cluster-containing hydrogenase component 2